MSAGKLLYVVYASSRPSRTKRLTSNFPISSRGYCEASNKINNNGHVEERAPSTADEFVRLAEEKSHHHNDNEGLGSQTIDKAKEAAGEALTATAMGESVESDHVKQSFKEAHDAYFGSSNGDFRRKGDKEEPS